MQTSITKKIFDCFIFFNELDLLKIRLNELYDVVDFFVICESDVTFTGHHKPLVFAENREMFRAFADKIIHLVVTDMPTEGTAWDREFHQRNAIRRALPDAAPHDVVIISDVDEIIRKKSIEFLRENEGYFSFNMKMYQFYINMFSDDWSLVFAYTWALDQDVGDYNIVRMNALEALNRFAGKNHRVDNGGWHFTFLGGADAIRNKLNAYSHTDQWQRRMQVPGAAERQLSLLTDVGDGQFLKFCMIDDSFPKYVQDNLPSLINAGLVKDFMTRLRELEAELTHFYELTRHAHARERYKDIELERARVAGVELNLALHQPATQSSVAPWSRSSIPEEDAKGANGGTISEPGAYAFHTNHEQDPWWQVDLGADSIVHEVRIYNRRQHPERLRHFSLLKSHDGLTWEVIFRKADDAVFDAEPYIARLPLGERMRFLRVRLDGCDFLHFDQCLVYGHPATEIEEVPLLPGSPAPSRVVADAQMEETAVEAIRLVVWDLDDTFWRGTVSEGGITEYVRAHHDIVIALARRGIMSSICSKNNREVIYNILRENGIFDYFIFPSVSWESKGPRLVALIEAVQLRPATVMFIDDNPSNRAETASMLPDLQVVDHTFIPKILSDPRFAGKDDAEMTRLAQYKLLEARKKDEMQAVGGNEEFLRGCDVRVSIEYDVLPYLDRAIELINRTNQLNFTKRRLSEDMDEARAQLRESLSQRDYQAGLVRVLDKYGDYGFVGFFMLENRTFDVSRGKMYQDLVHYCFSCRTLGMLVERWLYDWLQRPEIDVIGNVLTDLTEPCTVDWIQLAPPATSDLVSLTKVAPEIRLHGGCEAASIVHYLKPYADEVVVTGNFFAGAHFVRVNGASLLLSACDRKGPEFEREARELGIPYETLISHYFEDPPEGTVFIFGGQYDCPGPHRYRHKIHGWELKIEPHSLEEIDVVGIPEEELVRHLEGLRESPEVNAEIISVAWHVRRNYETVSYPSDEALAESMHALIGRVPVGSKLVVMLDDARVRGHQGLEMVPWVKYYEDKIRPIAESYPFVKVVSFADCIRNEDEIHFGGNHYDRLVYYRMSEAILSAVRTLPAKNAEHSFPLAVRN